MPLCAARFSFSLCASREYTEGLVKNIYSGNFDIELQEHRYSLFGKQLRSINNKFSGELVDHYFLLDHYDLAQLVKFSPGTHLLYPEEVQRVGTRFGC